MSAIVYSKISTNDGGTYTTIPGEDVELAGSVYESYSTIHTNKDGEDFKQTYLVGKRGALYMLRGFLEKTDTGKRQIISMGSGSPLHKRGNEIKAWEIDGKITQRF